MSSLEERMKNNKLTCKKRNLAVKAKKIKQEGFTLATVYGHHMDPVSIQVERLEIEKFLKTNAIGSKVLLDIEGDEHMAIFKDAQRQPVSNKVIHIDFQVLTRGEKIKVTVPIIFRNKESLGRDQVLQEQLSEIEISTLPKFLIDHVDLDVSKYTIGDSITVSDLDVSGDKNIDIITPSDAQLCVISHAAKYSELPEDGEEAADELVPATETT